LVVVSRCFYGVLLITVFAPLLFLKLLMFLFDLIFGGGAAFLVHRRVTFSRMF
jgi:hypothetical protein